MAKRIPLEVKAFVRENVKGITTNELQKLVNTRFNADYTLYSIKGMVYGQGLKNGLDTRLNGSQGKQTRFKKGNVPANKGVKTDYTNYPQVQKNWFKKGQAPHNTSEVGSELVRTDGYTWIKVEQPNKWKQKHRLLWEQHYGPIKKGQIVTFLDGDKSNIDIVNLAVINQREHLRLNHLELRFDDSELTKTGINIVKLNLAIVDKTKKKENKKHVNSTDRK